MMPEKRKRDTQGGKSSKAPKSAQDKDFMTYMLANYNSDVVKDTNAPSRKAADSSDDDDSDGDMGAGGFSAFDLPNYDSVFNEGDDVEEDNGDEAKETSASGSKTGTVDPSGIIFVSDPTQLPQPLLFQTPTVMKPVVLGGLGGATTSAGQVVVINQPTKTSSGHVLVPHVQPVIMPLPSKVQTSQPPKTSARSASVLPAKNHMNVSPVGSRNIGRNAPYVQSRGSVPNRQVNARPAPIRNAAPVVRNITPMRNANPMVRNMAPVRNSMAGMRNKNSPESALATAAAQAVASGMSATNIMQQVVRAAQQAAQNIIRPAGQVNQPRGQMTNQPRGQMVNQARGQMVNQPRGQMVNQPRGQIRPGFNMRPRFTPVANTTGKLVNGNMRPGMVRPLGPRPVLQQQQQARQNGESASALEPLLARAKKWKPYSDTLTRVSVKIAGRTASPLTLKQMNSLLRLKFSTKQIYDMCLWDMEHPDASLMEIAIQNAFKTEA